MKVYTIKNKNGEYLSRNICWTNNETNIRFMSENDAKYTLKELDLMDCKIVEITIEETKNQTQKAIECLKEVLDHFTNRPTIFKHDILKFDISDTDKKFIDYVNNKIKELEEGK